ncbi:MAG: FtsX-like permease family protein [Pseudomonadota bacterium]
MSRRATALLTILSVSLSVALFLGVDKIRRSAEASFEATISNTDLIVGARSGPINLLLYSVFRIGNATSNISWESYEQIADRPGVMWTVPLSLGDSYRGFRVLGTNQSYFEHYKYAAGRTLNFRQGHPFSDTLDVVLGATVARELGHTLGDRITISHGLQSVAFAEHKDSQFTVTGILAPTGTPVDRTVHVSLSGLEAVHASFPSSSAPPFPGAHSDDHEQSEHDDHHHEAETITAFLVGLENRVMVLSLQRDINTYKDEALLAIIPGIALAELWSVVGTAETALLALSGFVVGTGLLGLLTAILTSLNERRREVAVLRAAGAQRLHIFSLLVVESALIGLVGSLLGGAIIYGGLSLAGPVIEGRFGIPFIGMGPNPYDLFVIGGVVVTATLLGAIPAWRAYKNALADGLSVKL